MEYEILQLQNVWTARALNHTSASKRDRSTFGSRISHSCSRRTFELVVFIWPRE